ncbi:uncharacterized protein LOC110677111 isoform X2 [Aedes aegypti]|nr:uncharacterized protein LOC110677111 isoform X2 [Aedes aegypti]
MDKSMSAENTPEGKYSILVIGETGTGKSTLINYLTNFFHGGKPGQLRLSIPSKHYNATEGLNHSEKNAADTSKSQTSKCMEYDFKKDGLVFSFIDTPGLCDTEGTHKDEENILKIMQAAVDKGTLVAIMIVINGTQPRATTNLQYTLNQMHNFVPDSFLDNIVVVLTNCNRFSANFDLSHLKPWKVLDSNSFYMDNFALSKPEKAWKNDKEHEKYVENGWKDSMETIRKMINQLKEMGSQATRTFKEMYKKRNDINSNIKNILIDLEKLQNLQNILEETKSNQQGISDDIEKYSNYKQTQEVECKEYVKSDFMSRICETCSNVCYKDWVQSSSILGIYTSSIYKIYKWTTDPLHKIVGRDYCYKCNCSLSAHYDTDEVAVIKMKTVEKVLHEIKALHEYHLQRNVDVENKISGLHDDIATVQGALRAKEQAIRTCCEDLKKVCSHFNFVNELGSIIDVMQKTASNLRSIEAKRNANKMIDDLRYFVDKLTVGQKTDDSCFLD